MKICFLLGGFQGNGGIGRVTSIVASYLADEQDYNVYTVCYCDSGDERLYKVSDKIKEYALYDRNISMTKAILKEHGIRKLKEIIVNNKIDIIIACGALYFPIAICSTWGLKCKCICVEHTSPETGSDYKFQMMCRRFAVHNADRIVTITDAAKDYYINKLNTAENKILRIYNPIPNEFFQSKTYNACVKKIISVGRLTYQKNFERLIDIAKEILTKFPDWSWDIYGEGELRKQLQEKIDNCGLSDRLIIRGQISNLLSIYQDYSFIVMTSRYEGFPMSLLEASANRLPMISFDIKTGPNEIICDGTNGFLYNETDTVGMISGISYLIQNENTRAKMSKEAYMTSQNFKIESVIPEWEKLFRSIA